MSKNHLPLLLASIATLTLPVAAQRFDASIFNSGLNGTISLLQGTRSTNLTAAGRFAIGANVGIFASTWNGAVWAPALPGTATATTAIAPAAARANGDVLTVAANATVQQGNPATGAWTTLGGPFFPAPLALADWNGVPVAGGSFGAGGSLVAWNGAGWVPLGSVAGQNVTGTVLSIVPMGTSLLVAGPSFSAPGLGVTTLASWNGTAWTAIAATPSGFVEHVTMLANGDFVTMHRTPGLGTQPPYALHRRSGTTWTQVGRNIDQPVRAILGLPDGDLLIGGLFTTVNGVAANGLARLRGVQCTSVANIQGSVQSLRLLEDDVLAVGGNFSAVNGQPASNLAGFRASTRGRVVPLGTGCVGIGGLNQLTAINEPLIGTTFSSTASGLGNPAFLVMIRGLATLPTPITLDTIFANGLPTCSLFISPDLLDLISLPGTGSTTLSFPIPADPLLVGSVLRQQAAYFEVAETTSTNAQVLTIGRF